MYNYEKRGEDYFLCGHNKEINVGKEVGLSYTYWRDENGKARGFLYKHGNREDTLTVHNITIEQYKKVSEDETIGETALKMLQESYFVSGAFDIEELNKCLSISDYVVQMHEKRFAIA
ncbi:MAG: hypothetical protein CL760_06880 [Chloroflexi bacterium]|nr:hypothetical protein [Chloroflexota bacterium]|tara:strand:+ start:87074 stop:87427 length:354 start_codon:yes stop_codon:yes gene_type:complete